MERRSRRLLTSATIWLFVCCSLATGCEPPGGPAPGPLLYDLGYSLPVARGTTEVRVLRPGDEASRAFLGEGFSWRERDGSGRSFAWSDGQQSTVYFRLYEPRPLLLKLGGTAHPSLVREGQPLEIRVIATPVATADPTTAARQNEGSAVARSASTAVGTVHFPGEATRDPTIEIPRHVQGNGEGLAITLVYGGEGESRLAPERAADGTGRQLAVAWHEIRLGDAQPEAGEPGPVSFEPLPGRDGSLLLPTATRISWQVDLPPDARLAFHGVEFHGDAHRLRIEVRAGAESVAVRELSASAPASELSLLVIPIEREEWTRVELALTALPERDWPGLDGRITIERALVREPASAPGSEG